MNPVDIAGERFGRLVAKTPTPFRTCGKVDWLCLCDCGTLTLVNCNALRNGNTRSCGCLRVEAGRASAKVHGGSRTRPYRIWQAMKTRCGNPHSPSYPGYGGRGITVCDSWSRSYEAFMSDMGPPPTARHSIDRIDGAKGYAPENCRWATPTEQARNTRRSKKIFAFGETKCASAWAEDARCSVSGPTICNRLAVLGWTAERAITAPLRGEKD